MHIAQFVITVRDYDEALAFYVGVLNFTLLEDTDMGNGKRWVRIHPPAPTSSHHVEKPGCDILLARAVTPQQLASVGNQTGGRVFIFLHTDDFHRDHALYTSRGVRFLGPPRNEPYGTVAVFEDLYGNKFDLVEPRKP